MILWLLNFPTSAYIIFFTNCKITFILRHVLKMYKHIPYNKLSGGYEINTYFYCISA